MMVEVVVMEAIKLRAKVDIDINWPVLEYDWNFEVLQDWDDWEVFAF